MITFLAALVTLIPFYLIGCFPTGMLVAKGYGVDITAHGSGNVGATNVGRVIGKKAGIFTWLADMLKGSLAVGIAGFIAPFGWLPAAAAAAVVCGHCFSLPPRFKGGKGVATALGTLLVLFPIGALVAIISFGTTFAALKMVSVSSLAATLAVPLLALVTDQPDSLFVSLAVISVVIVYRHRDNIIRIIEGREPRFSARKKG